jgi:acyl-coenzyme A synthetase/AMP-(fatty) acid ligase
VVKIAGKRVDLEEIREKIRMIPGVADACVTVLPAGPAQQAQVAALVATDLPAREIRAAVRVMEIPCGRPRKIRTVTAIPVLPNGKLDRRRIEQILLSHHGRTGAEGKDKG